ncbi:iron chelate uptake ABC transporter family permease subunit [Rothia kristinae]
MAAVAVSAAGPIPFVAFVAPQIAQRLTGAATPPLWCSALTGMLLVSAADLVARTVLPWELPLGIVTAVCGAPVLIWLVLKMNRKASA